MYVEMKRYRIKKILSLKDCKSGILLPTRNRGIVLSGLDPVNIDVVIYKEVLILFEIIKTINKVGIDSEIEMYKYVDSFDHNKNIFYFGGYLVHDYVKNILVDKFSMVKFTCSKKSYEAQTDDRVKKLLQVSECDSRWHILINDVAVLEYDASEDSKEGYVVLIKRTGLADFGSDDYGTEHICFGNTPNANISIARSFVHHTNGLYKHLKKHKSHYFIIAKFENGKINYNSIIDLTDIVFK